MEDGILLRGIFDGRYRKVKTGINPYGFVRDVDVVVHSDEFDSLEKTGFKVKLSGKEYDVFRFEAKRYR